MQEALKPWFILGFCKQYMIQNVDNLIWVFQVFLLYWSKCQNYTLSFEKRRIIASFDLNETDASLLFLLLLYWVLL